MDKKSSIHLGIMISDSQINKIEKIQSILSDNLKYNISFEDTVHTLLLYSLSPENVQLETRKLIATFDSQFLNVIDDVVKSSLCLDDYV